MKIAIFHNFMDNIGGAEIVTLTLTREFNSDLYTTNIDPDKIKKMGFEDVLPRIKSIGKIPKIAPLRHQLALWKFRRLNLGKNYDTYIISGDWAMSGAVHNHPNLWYVHSPLNELWAFKNYIEKDVLLWWKRPIFNMWVWFNRILTIKYSKHIDVWVCNSKNTQNRIKKYYNQSAQIVYPPTDFLTSLPKESQNYWLSVNRLTKPKRIEIQIEAFKKLPNEKLIIVGSYEKGTKQFEEYKKYLDSIKPDNVEILNWVDSKKMISLYSHCKGFITTAKDEDFGMTPIEAMVCGKPVIAPNEGGYKETIIDNKTGILIDNIDEDKLITAIRKMNEELKKDSTIYKLACVNQAKKFTQQVFIKKLKHILNKIAF